MNLEILQPTTFPLDSNDVLAPFHRVTHDYLKRLPPDAFTIYDSPTSTNWQQVRAQYWKAAAGILAMPFETQLNCIRAGARFSYWSRFEWGWSSHEKVEETHRQMAYESALFNLCLFILEQPRGWSEEELRELIELAVPYSFEKRKVVTRIFENYLSEQPVSGELKSAVETVRAWNARVHLAESWRRLGAALGDELGLQSGESWAEDARKFIAQLPEKGQVEWRAFFLFCFDSDKIKPSAKWLQQARVLAERIGARDLEPQCAAWFAVWGDETPLEINEAVLKGVVWSAALLSGAEIAPALEKVALSAAQIGEPNESNHRTLSPSVFNASVWALSQKSDGLPVLLALQGKIRQKSLNNSLEKAIVVARNRV